MTRQLSETQRKLDLIQLGDKASPNIRNPSPSRVGVNSLGPLQKPSHLDGFVLGLSSANVSPAKQHFNGSPAPNLNANIPQKLSRFSKGPNNAGNAIDWSRKQFNFGLESILLIASNSVM